MGDDNYQDLGLGDEVGPMGTSDLTVEAQAQEAFNRMAPKVPEAVSERFVQLGMEACRQIAANRPNGRVSVDELVVEFEQILRTLINESK